MSNSVLIRELAPREGFQILKKIFPTEDKLRLIRALAAARIPEIEVTSFVRADRVPQLADCEQVVAELAEPPPGVIYRALCLNPKGFTRSLAFSNLAHPAWFYTGASDTFLNKNANTSFQSQLDSLDVDWGSVWRSNGSTKAHVMISNVFGCSYEGEIADGIVIDRWQKISKVFNNCGFKIVELSLADTVGFGTASRVKELIGKLRTAGAPEISLHLHDTRGKALECLEAGLELGVRIVESSIAGLGGCPFTVGAAGNIDTEQVVNVCSRLGLETGIAVKELSDAAQLAQRFLV